MIKKNGSTGEYQGVPGSSGKFRGVPGSSGEFRGTRKKEEEKEKNRKKKRKEMKKTKKTVLGTRNRCHHALSYPGDRLLRTGGVPQTSLRCFEPCLGPTGSPEAPRIETQRRGSLGATYRLNRPSGDPRRARVCVCVCVVCWCVCVFFGGGAFCGLSVSIWTPRP